MIPSIYKKKSSKNKLSASVQETERKTLSKSLRKTVRHSKQPLKSPKRIEIARKSLSLHDFVVQKRLSLIELKKTSSFSCIPSSDNMDKLLQRQKSFQHFSKRSRSPLTDPKISLEYKHIYENEIFLDPFLSKVKDNTLLLCNKTLCQSISHLNKVKTSLQFFNTLSPDMMTLKNCKVIINTCESAENDITISGNLLLVKSENYGRLFLIDHNKTRNLKNLSLRLEKQSWQIQVAKKYLYQTATNEYYCLKWRVISK